MKKNMLQPSITEEFYSVNDIVSMGLASRGQVYTIFNSSDFPAIKIGSVLRVRKSDFWAWIELQKIKK